MIIPAYNAERLIMETIGSVLDQTYPNVEIVVVDDGSKDGTEAVLERLKKDGTIIYIKQENQGQAAARKNGFLASKGSYISFLDADDLISPDKISIQVDFMEKNHDCGVCYSDIYHFWNHDKQTLLKKKLEYHSGYIFDKLIKNNVIQVATALIRRSALEAYGVPGAEFRRSDDWYLWLNLARNGIKFCFLNKVLAFQRRQREGTLSDQRSYFKETADTNLKVYDYYRGILTEKEREEYDLDGLISFWKFRRSIGCVILGDKKGAKQSLAEYEPKNFTGLTKKFLFSAAISIVPVRIFGGLILLAREFMKKRSFIPVSRPETPLPNPSLNHLN